MLRCYYCEETIVGDITTSGGRSFHPSCMHMMIMGEEPDDQEPCDHDFEADPTGESCAVFCILCGLERRLT